MRYNGQFNKTAKRQQKMTLPERQKALTANSTYPKGGVSCFADTFVQAESSVLRMKFSGKSPAFHVAAKR